MAGGVFGGEAFAFEFDLALGAFGVVVVAEGEAEVVAGMHGAEFCAAVGALLGVGVDVFAAGVAVAEVVGDAGDVAGDGPELSGGGSAEDGGGGDSAGLDHGQEGVVGAAGAEGVLFVADVPGAHGDLGGFAGEGLEEAAAGGAAVRAFLNVSAVGADDEVGGVSGGGGFVGFGESVGHGRFGL